MGDIYYTILVGNQVLAHDVKAEFVPTIIKGLLAEWFADYNLKLSVEAQERPYHLESFPPNIPKEEV